MIPAMIGLFLVFSGTAVLLGYRHLETSRESILLADRTTADLLATFLAEHEKAVIGLLRSYAARPLFINAVKTRSVADARWHLERLKKNHEIDLTFVTDPRGVLWLNYPFFPEAIGKDLSYRDWYKGVSALWAPYVSEVFQLIVADKPLAVAIAVPIVDEKGKVIGILANSHRLTFLNDTIERVPLSPHTAVTIVDRKGQILFSNRYAYQGRIIVYPHLPMIEQALKEKGQQIEDTRHKDLGRLYISAAPVADIGWTVVVERGERDVYLAELPRLAEIAGAALLLFILTSLSLAYLRRFALYRKTEELLAAQRDALEQERRYRSLLETVHMIAVGLDAEGNVTFANSFLLELTGYSAAEILGENWFDRFLPEEEKQAVKQVFRDLRGDSVISHYVNRILTRAGRERLIAWDNTVLQDPQGRFAGTMSLGVDITEINQTLEALRDSEEKYRGLFEGALEGIYQSTPEGRFLSANPAMAKIYGYDSAEELIESVTDMTRQIYVHPEDRSEILRIVTAEGILSDYEVRHSRKDGSPVWLSLHARAVRDESGKVIRLDGMAVDITERKRAVEEIRRLNEELEQRVRDRTALLEAANRELEAFSYSVSHDLRAPLRGIDGFSQALLEDYREGLDETGRDYLDRVRRAAQKMGFLIDDILKLSRVTRYELHREPVDLSRIVRELLESYQKDEPGRIVEEIVQDGIVVQGDPYLLQIALENLIDNAWKFTSGMPRGRIEFGSFDERGKTVYFIRDNGVGFDMTYVDKLFGAFQRLHRSEEFPGTGIGLATVKRIVSRHEGWIRAEGRVGEGATFFFTLA